MKLIYSRDLSFPGSRSTRIWEQDGIYYEIWREAYGNQNFIRSGRGYVDGTKRYGHYCSSEIIHREYYGTKKEWQKLIKDPLRTFIAAML